MAEIDGGDQAVELVVCDTLASPDSSSPGGGGNGEETAPLLNPAEKPKFNVFSVSHPRRRPREQVIKLHDVETSLVSQFVPWVWSGSRYSGLLCVALSSTIYFIMEVLSDFLSTQSIPLFETAFTRCTLISILSCIWLKRSGQPIFGPGHARKLLFSRAFTGFLSLSSFIFCIQRLPLSQATVLSFTSPIMASVVARIIMREKLKIADVGGLACSFFGILFIFRQILDRQGGGTLASDNYATILEEADDDDGGLMVRAGKANYTAVVGTHRVFVVIIGLFSSITGGVSYCLIKAGAKASDQPVSTVLSFGMLGSPTALICTFAFEVRHGTCSSDIYSFFLILMLGTLAFFAEVLLARGLHLEKVSKAVNILYIEAALSQLWGISSNKIAPSFGGLAGCLLILISVCCTIYVGPDKEAERGSLFFLSI